MRSGSPHHRTALAVVPVLAALLTACTAEAHEDPPRDAQITVMTQNLYVGTGVGEVFAASTEQELVAAGSRAWDDLLATDFPARAGALADEIAEVRPDVVGLQEVTLWRDQAPGDVLTQGVPDATHVAFDFLAILLAELSDRGVEYTAVATSTNADIEFPREGADVRLTDRDVLLVRDDVEERVSNPASGRYTAQFREGFLAGQADSIRSWLSVDYRPEGAAPVRIFSTHLEVAEPVTGTAQQEQAAEFLGLVAASPHPVIALGDFNSPEGAPAYSDLTAVLEDAWTTADPGATCCRPPSLADPVGREQIRIDLVLTAPELQVTGVRRVGDRPFRAAPPPLWISDHNGVTARIVVPGR